jgi:2-polyprenyl-3-methyl-5-hydroxy-6-metoxy-1,4-benzoquinol methylase
LENIKSLCIEEIEPKELYGMLRERGNEYGPAFSSIKETVASRSEAFVKIKVPDSSISEAAMSLSAYTLHPVVFDALLQVPVYLFSRAQQVQSIMPIAFDQVILDPNLVVRPGQTFEVYCKIRDVSQTSCHFDIVAFEQDNHGLMQPVVQCQKGELRATGEVLTTALAETKDTTFQLVWDLDPASITSTDLESVTRSAVMDVKFQEEKLNLILATANRFISDALNEVKKINRIPTEGHLSLAYREMVRRVERCGLENPSPIDFDQINLQDLGVEGELLSRIGPNLGSILAGKTDALSVLLDDKLLYRIYQEDSTTRCNSYLIEYLRHLIFKYPSLRILEVGAGTGGTTVPLFEALASHGQLFFDCYHFTDISSGFFDEAKDRLGQWADEISFRTLNIEEDPLTQGFDEHFYDLVIASNVMHATRDISTTLGNIHRLLKPRGTFAFIELIKTNLLYTMTVGLLPGWWSGMEIFS